MSTKHPLGETYIKKSESGADGRQEECIFDASLGYIARLFQEKTIGKLCKLMLVFVAHLLCL